MTHDRYSKCVFSHISPLKAHSINTKTRAIYGSDRNVLKKKRTLKLCSSWASVDLAYITYDSVFSFGFQTPPPPPHFRKVCRLKCDSLQRTAQTLQHLWVGDGSSTRRAGQAAVGGLPVGPGSPSSAPFSSPLPPPPPPPPPLVSLGAQRYQAAAPDASCSLRARSGGMRGRTPQLLRLSGRRRVSFKQE